MTRQTSREAYLDILNSGELGRMQREVLKAIFELGECTSGEAFHHMQANGVYKNPLNQSRARFTELSQKGAIKETGKRNCKISGKSGIVWAPTWSNPMPVASKPKNEIRELRELLESYKKLANERGDEILRLKSKLFKYAAIENKKNKWELF